MIMDERSEMATGFPLSVAAPGTYRFGDVVDLGAGTTSGMSVVLTVDEAVTSGGAATVAFHLCSDSSGEIATDGSATYHFSTGAIPIAQLVPGYIASFPICIEHNAERFLGLLQTIAGAALTGGKVSMSLVSDVAAWRPYADARN